MKKTNFIEGVNLSSSSSNTRYGKREDTALIVLDKNSVISGKFTSNKFQAAPVKVAKKHLKIRKRKQKTAFIINAGNANAGTGKQGEEDVKTCCEEVAKLLNIEEKNVIPFSTGIIGEYLETKKHIEALKKAEKKLNPFNWNKVSKSILTTDTKPKLISKEIKIGKQKILVKGLAKGSGMIRPDFATLLSFVFLDAKINESLLSNIHKIVLQESFESITVDGDTSPNDSSVLVATGRPGKQVLKNSKELSELTYKLKEIYKSLALKIIDDAEGSSKQILVKVTMAQTKKVAKSIAFNIAESLLVKTAFYGNDPNWGRIMAAIGRTQGVKSVSKVDIALNKIPLIKHGNRDQKYTELKAQKAAKAKLINILVNLNDGEESFSVLTSDLTKEYVSINSDYKS